MVGVLPGLPELCVTFKPETAPDNACAGLEKTPTFNDSSLTLEIRPMKNLVIKGTANWYYSEGVYESFTKDFETAPGKFNTTRASSAKFERDFSQTFNRH